MGGMLARIREFERRRRFWRLVDVRGRDECWTWRGPVDSGGMPFFGGEPAERQAYEAMHGSLPAGIRLRRTCGSSLCVNPEHMERVAGER